MPRQTQTDDFDESVLEVLRCTRCERHNRLCDKLDISHELSRPCNDCSVNGRSDSCSNNNYLDMWLDFRHTVINSIVPPLLYNHFLDLFDARSPEEPVLVWAALALVSHSPRWADTPIDQTIMMRHAAYRAEMDFGNEDPKNAMTCLVFVLIQSPLLLALAKKATDDELWLKMTKALSAIREYRYALRRFTPIYEYDEDAGPLIAPLNLPGHPPTLPAISALPPVLAVKRLVNLIGADEWGHDTDACKTFLRNAIEHVYTLDYVRSRAEHGHNINVDKELVHWMVLVGRPPVNAHVFNNPIWHLILCHWATMCAKRQTVWYLTGFAGRLFNKFWSGNEHGNKGEKWKQMQVAVVMVMTGLGCPASPHYAGVRADPSL